MRLSLAFGVVMLVIKVSAWIVTGSAAIMSDASESIIHVVAVAFAAYSLRVSERPADSKFLFGYERIAFFSAGFEGSMIGLAGISIIVTAVEKWRRGIELESLGAGTAAVAAAALMNLGLGLYLLRVGKKTNSIILEANGKHVLTDSWTSAGVIVGLCLVLITGWKPFDPLCAIAVALNILWSGYRLIQKSVRGLMDYADPRIGTQLRAALDEASTELGISYHGVRFREAGRNLVVTAHLLFPFRTPLGEAHALATRLEQRIAERFGRPVEVLTHLEALEDHASVHERPHYTGRPDVE